MHSHIESCESGKALAPLLRILPFAVLITDADGRVVLANEAAEDLFEFSPDSRKKIRLSDLLEASRLPRRLAVTSSSPKDSILEFHSPDKAGRLRKCRSALWGENNGLVIVVREADGDQKAAQREDHAASRLRHEVLTPLTSLRGLAEILSTRDLSKEKRERLLALMLDEAKRLEDWIGAMLGDFERMTASGRRP